ncbi:PHP domain-containing protein [Nocardioides sp. DS6]|uniref:Histidinol-phosphatase n=1 Tax=Nocardioides eburneus TaxID=3231482 RepID=A0ABV3SUQ2_9ACTN
MPEESLPADNHVHSEWSWDTRKGDMEATCARAVALGLPSIAFTEHVDHTARSGPFDAEGYLAAVDRCRDLFPSLRILTGVEIGEAHWDPADTEALLAGGRFERVLASLHSVPELPGHPDMAVLYDTQPRAQVLRDYLAEIEKLITAFDGFQVLAHIDYPARRWPLTPTPSSGGRSDKALFDPRECEEEYRHVLRTLAGTGRVLEFNTRVPLHPLVLDWWREVGGDAVSFASDAHRPEALAHGFREAVAVASAAGFRPGRDPLDFWRRA